MVTKHAVTPGTVATYMTQINKWYAARTGQPKGVTLDEGVVLVLAQLRKALPHGNAQKAGVTASQLREIVDAVGQLGLQPQEACMWRAMYTLAWFGVLRPGEFTVPTSQGYYVTMHAALANVTFWQGDAQVYPGSRAVPTHMKFVVKQSKTDQERLTKDVIIGATGDVLCAVSWMWQYLTHRGEARLQQPLFVANGTAVTYTAMRRNLAACLRHTKVDASRIGGHSFRIGGSQALAAAGKSITYIMSYGRWKCPQSVLRYVVTPVPVRTQDAPQMVTAPVGDTWAHAEQVVRSYYDAQPDADKLFAAKDMLATTMSVRA